MRLLVNLFISLNALAIAGIALAQTPQMKLVEKVIASSLETSHQTDFVYITPNQVEQLRFTHISDKANPVDKLTYLNGPVRHILRNKYGAVFLVPQNYEEQLTVNDLSKPFFNPTILREILNSEGYRVSFIGKGRVANKPATYINISAKDEHRYSYGIWIDEQSGLMLRTVLKDKREKPLETMEVLSRRMLSISELDKEISNNERKMLAKIQNQKVQEKLVSIPWRVNWTPAGYKVNRFEHHYINDIPTFTLTITDGLSKISVYVEEGQFVDKEQLSLNRVGITTYFEKIGRNSRVTVVGDIPEHTAKMIGSSVYRLK
jgi:sigma-E factor negative regulatory protein RseB